MIDEKPPSATADWVKKVQARSWEIELLISGGSLFSLIQLSDLLIEFMDKLTRINVTLSLSVILYSFVTPVLLGGFVLHLITRAFWLAMVILHKVYPNGINAERVQLHELYMKPIRSFDLLSNIERIDKVCSTIFTATFVYALFLFGLATLAGITIALLMMPNRMDGFFSNDWLWLPYSLIVILFSFAYFLFLYIDLPTFGLLRRGKWIARIWYPFYQFFNFLTLGFLWRPYLQIITSNLKSKLLIASWIVVFYAVGIVFVLSGNSNNHQVIEWLDATIKFATPSRESHYQDKNDVDKWTDVTIQSAVIEDDYVRVFVPSHKLQSPTDNNPGSPSNVAIAINDSVYASIKWIGITRNNGQNGLETVIGIQGLKSDLHLLKIMAPSDTTLIHFWKP